MKSKLVIAGLMIWSQLSNAHVDPLISTAKIAELSAHRVDRLATLGKIDGSFVKKLEKISVETVAGQDPVAYRAIVSQTAPQAGQPLQLELKFDHDGKPLSFRVLSGGVAGSDMGWAPKTAGELVENGMHYVLDNRADPKVVPYFASFTNLELIKGSLNGKVGALVQVSTSTSAKKLNINVNLDGTLDPDVPPFVE